MRKQSLYIIAIITILSDCGKNSGSTSGQATMNNIDAFAAKSNLGAITCDGEGTELSGNYIFNFSQSTLKCPQAKDINFNAASTPYTCIQKDKDFSCTNATASSDKYSGCVNKDGKFKLSLAHDENTDTKAASPVLQSGTLNVFMIGTLNKSGGTVQYSILKQAVQGSASCVANAQLEVQQASQ